jgi:hypothetical protein
LCDFRKVKYITNDLVEFVEEFSFRRSKLLVDKNQISFFNENIKSHMGIFPVNNASVSFNEGDIDMNAFAYYDYAQPDFNEKWKQLEVKYKGIPTREEFKLFVSLRPSTSF